MTNGPGVMAMRSDSEFTVVCVASVNLTVKVKLPTSVGLPEITPVVGAKVKPGGIVPVPTLQVRGAVPPANNS